ncbi:MAG: potassium channel protein [Saprospiraceae bacterium]|nr:potassium channel protein [Saprospiraceae bacterium]
MKRLAWFRGWNVYTIPSSFLSIQIAIGLLISDLLIGIAGFMLIEKYSLLEAFYMTVITISTVGYTEVSPLDAAGKLFTSIYIITNIGVFAYILAVFSYYVVQGEIFKNMHINHINKEISQLSNHIIICGYGRYGKEIAQQLRTHTIPFVIIDADEERIGLIQKSSDELLYVHDDATHDEALEKAGIKKAQALISALPDDTSNVFTVLSARQMNKDIIIVSRASSIKSEKKLRLAGANHVVMPEQIGGFYMATIISKPGAVEFFSYITRSYQADIVFEEVHYEALPTELQGKTIRDMHLRKVTGANIIGFKRPDGRFVINPEPDTAIIPSSSFIILGDRQQIEALRKFFYGVNE